MDSPSTISKEEHYPRTLHMKHFWASKYQKIQKLLETEKELQQISLQRKFPYISENRSKSYNRKQKSSTLQVRNYDTFVFFSSKI